MTFTLYLRVASHLFSLYRVHPSSRCSSYLLRCKMPHANSFLDLLHYYITGKFEWCPSSTKIMASNATTCFSSHLVFFRGLECIAHLSRFKHLYISVIRAPCLIDRYPSSCFLPQAFPSLRLRLPPEPVLKQEK